MEGLARRQSVAWPPPAPLRPRLLSRLPALGRFPHRPSRRGQPPAGRRPPRLAMSRPVLIAVSIAAALWILPSELLPNLGLPTSRAADTGEDAGANDPPRPIPILDRPQVHLLLTQYCGDCHG